MLEWDNAGIIIDLINNHPTLSYVEKQAALGVLAVETNDQIAERLGGNVDCGTVQAIIARTFRKLTK